MSRYVIVDDQFCGHGIGLILLIRPIGEPILFGRLVLHGLLDLLALRASEVALEELLQFLIERERGAVRVLVDVLQRQHRHAEHDPPLFPFRVALDADGFPCRGLPGAPS